LLPGWTRQGPQQEQPPGAHGTTTALAGGLADPPSSSYRHSGTKPSVGRSVRPSARACGNAASQGGSPGSRGLRGPPRGRGVWACHPRTGGRMLAGAGKGKRPSACSAPPWDGPAPAPGGLAGPGGTVGVRSAARRPSSGRTSALQRSQRNAPRHWRWGIAHPRGPACPRRGGSREALSPLRGPPAADAGAPGRTNSRFTRLTTTNNAMATRANRRDHALICLLRAWAKPNHHCASRKPASHPGRCAYSATACSAV
jgi:hypothetical protein